MNSLFGHPLDATIDRRNGGLPRGFTLIELLVVIVIIGILVGISLVAVQRVRDASRRASCMNNIRQLGLASLNYESAHGELPLGVTIPGFGTSIRNNELFGWGTTVLPYVEQNAAYEVLFNGSHSMLERATHPTNGSNVIEVLKKRIPLFQCPADSGAEPLNLHRTGSSVIGAMATSNYVAANNVGICHALRDPFTREPPRGAFHGIESESLAAFRDGTSNTVLFSERIYNARSSRDSDSVGAAALQYGSRGIGSPADYSLPGIQDTHFGCVGRINYFESSPNPGIARHGVSSGHSGGFVVASADGSTHFLEPDIDSFYRENSGVLAAPDKTDYGTWEKLIDISDGIAVSIGD